MLTAVDNAVRKSSINEKFVLPLIGPMNIKMLSFGHVNPNAGVVGAVCTSLYFQSYLIEYIRVENKLQ